MLPKPNAATELDGGEVVNSGNTVIEFFRSLLGDFLCSLEDEEELLLLGGLGLSRS